MRIHRPLLALLGAALAGGLVAGCQDLDVTNPNDPDRFRAASLPAAAESFVATSFLAWWEWDQDTYPGFVTSTVADEFTSAFADFGQLETSSEPRQSWNNSAAFGRNEVNEDPWYGFYSIISTVNDALRAIDSGMVIVDANQTARAESFGKFTQSLAHGYLALLFDRAWIIEEDLDLESIPTSEIADHLVAYPEVMDAAIAQMEEAIAIAEANDFALPGGPTDAWLFTPMTNEQFVQLMHSFLARYLAYLPRTRADRDAVDWEAVIAHIDAGITEDFAPIGQPDILFSDWKRLASRVRNVTRPGDFARLDYWLVGPADTTEGFQNWKNTPLLERVPFRMITPDRRLQGAAVGSIGKYAGYNAVDLFAASRGRYHQSHYYFHRFGTGVSWESGPLVIMTVTEMNLLKAEALIRLGRADEAVPLINLTREANGELPPVTIAGPPDDEACVPRKEDGSCGSLWDALRYEKRIEMAGVTPHVAYFDARGWQTLKENSFVHLPIPGRELGTLALPLYTFGGGLEASAPAPDPERCPGPTALPRCP
jgi:hypothetical protein